MALARRKARLEKSEATAESSRSSSATASDTKRGNKRTNHGAILQPESKVTVNQLSRSMKSVSNRSSTPSSRGSRTSSPVERRDMRVHSQSKPNRPSPKMASIGRSPSPLCVESPLHQQSNRPSLLSYSESSSQPATQMNSAPSPKDPSIAIGPEHQVTDMPDVTPAFVGKPPAPPPLCFCQKRAIWTRRRWRCARVLKEGSIGTDLSQQSSDCAERACALVLVPGDMHVQPDSSQRPSPELVFQRDTSIALARHTALALTAAAFPIKKPRRDPCMLRAENGRWDREDREDWESMAMNREKFEVAVDRKTKMDVPRLLSRLRSCGR